MVKWIKNYEELNDLLLSADYYKIALFPDGSWEKVEEGDVLKDNIGMFSSMYNDDLTQFEVDVMIIEHDDRLDFRNYDPLAV